MVVKVVQRTVSSFVVKRKIPLGIAAGGLLSCSYLRESVYQVVLQKSIPARIHQLILYHH